MLVLNANNYALLTLLSAYIYKPLHLAMSQNNY